MSATSAFRASFPSRAASMPRVSRPAVDDAAVRGLRHGASRRTSVSTTCSRTGRRGLSHRLRSADAVGLRLRPPEARARSGRCGVAIDSLDDMETLFDGIHLDEVIDLDDHQLPRADPAGAVSRGRAKSRARLGTSSAARCRTTSSRSTSRRRSTSSRREPSMRLITDIVRVLRATNVPQCNTISISGYHIREAGSTAVQELAFTLRDGMEYVEYGVWRAGWTSMSSRRGSRSSSTRTTICSRRSRSSARRAASGRE